MLSKHGIRRGREDSGPLVERGHEFERARGKGRYGIRRGREEEGPLVERTNACHARGEARRGYEEEGPLFERGRVDEQRQKKMLVL